MIIYFDGAEVEAVGGEAQGVGELHPVVKDHDLLGGLHLHLGPDFLSIISSS